MTDLNTLEKAHASEITLASAAARYALIADAQGGAYRGRTTAEWEAERISRRAKADLIAEGIDALMEAE